MLALAHRLRDRGSSVEYALRHQAVGKQLKGAVAAGARKAIILGPDEREEGVVIVRELTSGEEVRVPLERLAEAG
jgi:histidyl-tRNA synthetase